MNLAGYPQASGWRNRRQCARLAAAVDTWPSTAEDAVVNRHDYPTLSRRQIVELLYERGWFYVGQDIEAERWPLFLTRNRRLVSSAEDAATPETRLRGELRATVRAGRGMHLVNLVRYPSLARRRIEEIARGESWLSAGPALDAIEPTLRLLRPGTPAVDQFASAEDVQRAQPVPGPESDREPGLRRGIPVEVRRAVNRAIRWGVLLVAFLWLRTLPAISSNPDAVLVTAVVAVVVAVRFAFLALRALRRLIIYRHRKRAGRLPAEA